jgi:monoamine oxidase
MEMDTISLVGVIKMNLNSQFSFDPPQPDNPSDSDRFLLERYALDQKGWPEDFNLIKELMSPPPAITTYAKPGACSGLKVGVIGGGLAGLSAAFELRKLGFDITIYDALEDRIGGRVYTYYFNRQKNLYHEFGAMRIPVSHETVWHYLNLFHLPTRPFIQYNPCNYVYLKQARVRNDPYGYNVMQDIYPKYNLNGWERTTSWQRLTALGIESHLLSAPPEERSEIIQVKPIYSKEALLWGNNANINMMKSAGLSQEAINLVSNFQPLLCGNLYNSYIDFVQEDYPANLTFLYEIPGGMVKLPMVFQHSLLNPNPFLDIPADCLGSVKYLGGCWVDGIYLESDGKKVKLTYQHLKSKQCLEEKFDYIVCAIPFSTLRTINISPLFSNIKMRAIREVNYTPAQKSLLLCKERFWEKDRIIGGGSYTDLPISSIWYPSDHAKCLKNPEDLLNDMRKLPWNEPGVIIGSYNFNLDTTRLTNQPDERTLEEIKKEIEGVHGLPPKYLDHIVEGFKTVNWDQEPATRGALSFFSPEQKKIFSYGMALPEYDGRIFFAGEHISAIHRWMQGALQSGMQAANDLVIASIR